jgi:hypothetical protein
LNTFSSQFLYWTPRALCILFACFLGVFAADVFREGSGFWETGVALLMHLIPVFIVLLVLVLAWRREWIGGVFFNVLGLYYFFSNLRHLGWVVIVSGPLFLIGILFFVNWLNRGALRART